MALRLSTLRDVDAIRRGKIVSAVYSPTRNHEGACLHWWYHQRNNPKFSPRQWIWKSCSLCSLRSSNLWRNSSPYNPHTLLLLYLIKVLSSPENPSVVWRNFIMKHTNDLSLLVQLMMRCFRSFISDFRINCKSPNLAKLIIASVVFKMTSLMECLVILRRIISSLKGRVFKSKENPHSRPVKDNHS